MGMNLISSKPQVLRSTRDANLRYALLMRAEQLSRAPHLFSLGITWCIVHANDRTDVCSASGESKSEEENEDDDTNIENCCMEN